MSVNLRETARKFMIDNYGSYEIKRLKFRDSFVMIGQKGIPKGIAFEKSIWYNKIAPKASSISRCVSFPCEFVS